ncbi:nucleotidyltransferase domain-containing protein [uncultured Alistipes sp.]|jgi:uncharacterized membrane protein (UPF0127 family)|uniref:nucleotidyltransferase domain-containing protein n=1 Tax=uncultured Alistipes sp. TaxID=538949 RepID=UPI0025F6B72A|nr:nucleotidyltransferase domain-containing protein [uncultured Alistipes sp.]
METNRNIVQGQPAQTILPASVQSENTGSESQIASVGPELPLPTDIAELQYDPAEAARIVHYLTDGYFDSEYILLFGKLVGGTPHSDPAAYDLLMVVRETPRFNWFQAKRILRYKMPYRHRKITYINLYILPLNYVQSNRTPFLYFAHAEGTLLYCSDHCCFRRPKRPIDFARAYADAKFHYDTFRTLGNDLLEQAQDAFTEGHNVRLAAQFTAQAAVYFYHTLYYVYHGMLFDLHDPVVMHDRMRTLSTKLMLVFDDNHIENIFTIPRLKEVLMKTTYRAEFDMAPHEAELHMERVQRAAEIIENCAGMRLELYKELSEKQ